MPVTPEEVKAFIADADKAKESWLSDAEKAWNEIKRTTKKGRRKNRYPAWYSIFRIRQPIVLSRIGVPIGKDTTKDGQDDVGATAAICLERLAVNLAKSFDFFDVMLSARDDFLITNFAQVRGYYEAKDVVQRVKEYITPQQMPDTGDVVFVDGAGKVIESDDIYQDDQGYFLYHDEVVDVEDERVCLENVLRHNIYIDPDISRFRRCKRIAFAEHYSEPEFIAIFGREALSSIPRNDERMAGADEAFPKKHSIKVFEYWDIYEKECYWLPENGSDFIKPLGYLIPEGDEYLETNGLYNLEGLFPCPPPLIINAPTDQFWPITEFSQIEDIITDIHTIFSRMISLTRAIRTRLLFDNNVEGLEAALHEAKEGDTFGVPNLASSLAGSGGTLDGVVQYIPVEKIIVAINNLYTSLDQRLGVLFRISGTNDLLQGLTAEQSGKTLGERQMEEKYATNQLYEPQRKTSEFVRDCYQLIVEIALKNFKQASLDRYIMPETLDPNHRQRYQAGIGMLKDDFKRFRIELETDSTIARNEEYDKKMGIELVNTLTAAIEKTAQVAERSPALVIPELHALKFLIQLHRQGKMFQSEITEAIDNVIKMAKGAQPAFNKDQTMAELEAKKNQAEMQVKQYEVTSNERLEMAKLSQDERFKQMEAALENYRMMLEQGKDGSELQLAWAQLNSEVMESQRTLQLKNDELMLQLKALTDKKEIEQFKLVLEQQLADSEAAARASEARMTDLEQQMSLRERYATEARLVAESKLKEIETQMKLAATMKELDAPPPPAPLPTPAPVNYHIKADVPEPSNLIRDEAGNIIAVQKGDKVFNVDRDEDGRILGLKPAGQGA